MKAILESKFIFFSASFLICLLLYYPSFSGGQIWDDRYFLFENKIITGDGLLLTEILTNFNWALSTLAHKLMYTLFEINYFSYHIVNFVVHFINSLLFFQFLRLYRIPHARWAYLLFLLHPAMIISVAWIIQFKTLLCALFTLLCLNLFALSSLYQDRKRKGLAGLSILSFLLSLSSKSASIPLLPAVFLINGINKFNKLLLIPLVLIIAAASAKLFLSPTTQEGILRAVTSSSFNSTQEFILAAVPQTFNWYFWQALIPLESIPIRGALPKLYAQSIVGLFTIVMFFILIWKNKRALRFFGASLVMLLPFLGLIPGPYMSSAWVSEQHLYLVLIFFIPALALIIESITHRKSRTLTQIVSLVFYLSISFMSINNYKDELHFFKSSFDYNNNLPAAFHLLSHYIANSQITEAKTHYYYLITTIPPEMRPMSNLFWAQIIQFEPIINVKESE